MKMQALENSREMFLQMTLVYVVDVLLLQTGNQVLEDHLLTHSDKKRRNNLYRNEHLTVLLPPTD